MLRKNYLENWKKSFDITGKTSKPDFWFFTVINFALFLYFAFFIAAIIEPLYRHENVRSFVRYSLFIIFFLPVISAGMRRMNDLQTPKYYIFIPFYNLYLLSLSSSMMQREYWSSNFPYMYLFVAFCGSIGTGILNILLAIFVVVVFDVSGSKGNGFGAIAIGFLTIPFSLFLQFLLLLFSRDQISFKKMLAVIFKAFLISAVFLIIILFNAIL